MEDLENSALEAIKHHIELLIDTKNILEQINKSKTKQLVNEDITREEYLEYKQKYEQDIERIKTLLNNPHNI